MAQGIKIDCETNLCLVAKQEVLVFLSGLERAAFGFLIRKAKKAPPPPENGEGVFTFQTDATTKHLIFYRQRGQMRTLIRVESSVAKPKDLEPEAKPGHGSGVATIYYILGIAAYLTGAAIFVAKNAQFFF